MKSIIDMFFVDSPIIITNLNRVDLVERAANSMARKAVLRMALRVIHVMLPDLARCAIWIHFRPVFFCSVPHVGD